ncbi:LamG-like jellyroll fold domain-containing protein [Algibacter sp. L1A34]|uniref:LamG-like jellyroll fold domain-containing protein n=1 Tax=Algibacter sp. L1A34 TaxID=2686365 RepID=UPI00131B7B33|nr:LamG-like jellyroll fold domain-containing protein [Algibacter sp. L1A34]
MNKIYSYLRSVLKNILATLLCLFAFNAVDAQCSYDINNLGGNDLVDWNGHYISKVTIEGDNSSTEINNSNINTSYTDYTSQSADVTVGNTYDFSVNSNIPWDNSAISIWIDYDNNGTYTEVYFEDFNTSNPKTGSFTIDPTANSGTSKVRIQVSYCSNCGGGSDGAIISLDGCDFTNTYRGDVEDYTLNINQVSITPVVADDNLDVLVGSAAGTANQVNVASNDYIGTAGGDTDNYSLSTVASNGIVTEESDGVFQYIPNSDFVGSDSFTYDLCNQFSQCETGIVSVFVGFNACVPTSNSNGTHYITNVYLPGETTMINNSSGDDGGYGNYIETQSADLTRGSTYPIELSVSNQMASENRSGWTVYIDLNRDGNITIAEEVWSSASANPSSSGEDQSLSSTDNTFNLGSITIPSTAGLGKTLMRIGARRYWDASKPCGNTDGQPEEFEDYIVDIKSDATAQEIDLYGNGLGIVSGATMTSTDNYTDFGVYDINSGAVTRTYVIENTGITDLVLQAPYVSVSGSTAFTVATQPVLTTLTPGESTTFTIAFNPDVIGAYTGVISILSNDVDENPFTFTVSGEGAQTFPDTDGDGVPDNIDIDDDNDGLTDSYESSICNSNSNASTAEVVFLNETFGAGNDRIQINGNYAGATTTYCWEDGNGSCPATYNPTSVNDGDYTVYHSVTNNNGVTEGINVDLSDWAEDYWYSGGDHTTGDTNGRMAIFNAATDPGTFYSQDITGVTTGVPIQFGFYAINLDRDNAPGVGGREKPEVVITIYDNLGNVIATDTSGEIPPTSASNPDGDWVKVSASFVSTVSQFTVVLSNANLGGNGNDLAIDDIFVTQTLCDLDRDGVADIIDLDNDNDGIPNVVELGLIDDNFDSTVYNDTTNPWVDANGNGMHDAYETITILDSDGDGVPDYLDLDSDNDGVFDAVEYNGFGDIDVNGNGTGDGSDYQDAISGIDTDDQDGDGILSIVDDNDNDSDGTDHGTLTYNAPLDSDGDGVPNYLDIDSNDAPNNTTNGSDIDTTQIYAYLDADNDGIIDGTSDLDNDGILDAFDTDNNVFGSPRDLSDSYTLFFDGRNDYVEDGNVINGWANATLMAWIKIEPGATGDRVVVGQNSFNIMVTNGGRIKVEANSDTREGSTALPEGIWVHVGATYSSTDGEFIVYVNGDPLPVVSVANSLFTDTSNFTIGRTPNTDTRYFEGEIDEVRLFNEALSETSFQRMVYQELSDTNFNQGAIVPLDIDAANTFNTSLVRYFKMDTFKDDIVDDATTLTIDVGTGARLHNIKNIYFQTAPLPYETKAVGSWSSTNTWLHGDVWDIDAEATNQDWSIVHVKHSLTTATRHATAGLIVDAGVELSIQSDVELNNSWYLDLAGLIDLEGESQLIQTENSVLVATGSIEKDQQGTENLYTYNAWSSPIHTTNPDVDINGNETYTVATVLKDGEDPLTPKPISFVSGYNGNNTSSPIEIANYWIWKFANSPSDSYAHWQQVKSTGEIKVGEGYTMKGPGTGSISTDKNYVFQGTPNNGEILLKTDAGNDYLVGNPYPSAIDGIKFLNDNPHLDGTLYFWEHYGGGSHILREYEGGYGTYNYSGGVPAIATKATPNADVSQTGISTKVPTRYIAVGQGFFVTATASGNTSFNNDQRVFVTEASATNSLFMKGTAGKAKIAAIDTSLDDLRTKLRLNYNSPNGYTRQILTTIDENATMEIDRGYDAPLTEDNVEDMYWEIDDNNFVIQGIDEPNTETKLPLSIKAKTAGEIEITLAELNYPTEDFELYIKDNLTDTYHDLIENTSFTTTVEKGVTSNRFEIVFAKPSSTLSISDNNLLENVVGVYYNTSNAAIQITNPDNFSIENIIGTNILGQKVLNEAINSSDKNITLPANLALGIYIFTIETDHSKIIKKMIIK